MNLQLQGDIIKNNGDTYSCDIFIMQENSNYSLYFSCNYEPINEISLEHKISPKGISTLFNGLSEMLFIQGLELKIIKGVNPESISDIEQQLKMYGRTLKAIENKFVNNY